MDSSCPQCDKPSVNLEIQSSAIDLNQPVDLDQLHHWVTHVHVRVELVHLLLLNQLLFLVYLLLLVELVHLLMLLIHLLLLLLVWCHLLIHLLLVHHPHVHHL